MLYCGLHIHKFTQMEDRVVHKVNFTADKSFVRIPFILGKAVGFANRTGINEVLKLLKVGFNLQSG